MNHLFVLLIVGAVLWAGAYMDINVRFLLALVGGMLIGHAIINIWIDLRKRLRGES